MADAGDAAPKPAAPTPVSEKILIFAFTSFLGFAVVEMVFAFASHSLSLLGDSIAMLVDSATYLANGLALRRVRVVTPAVFAVKLSRAALQSRQALLRDGSGLTLLVCKSSYAAVYYFDGAWKKSAFLLGASVLLNASESYRTRFEGL